MRDIEGYEGLYAVTSCGRIWSYKTKRFLKPFSNAQGYLRVSLFKDGHAKTFRVNRLVAQAYIPNPDNLPEVDHLDGNKEHNWIKNLEWVSSCENTVRAKGIKVKCVETGQIFRSQAEAAREMGVQLSNLNKVIKGERKTTGGYHFIKVEGDV